MTASTLRRADRQSASIGLIIEDVSNPFFSAVHRGVEDVARARGVLTFVGSSDEDAQRERELAEAFAARGVDGLVIVPCAGDQSYLMRDHQAGIALVFVDRPPHFLRGDAVVSDNRGGAPRGRRAPDRRRPPADRVPRRPRRGLHRRPSASPATTTRSRAAGIVARPALERIGARRQRAARAGAHANCSLGPDPPTALFTGQNLITIGAHPAPCASSAASTRSRSSASTTSCSATSSSPA